jgi:LysR family transcriptional regulator, low CO2-responsive transcriptional regulator
MLTLHKLEIFNTVSMEGSFSRAAERLRLTQPAVSQHIRDLEEKLGKELFRRGNRGVRLTPAGELLLDYTRCILRMLAEAESAIASLGELSQGQITMGATPGVGVYLLPGWVQTFRERFPEVVVTLNTDTTAGISAGVLNGLLDVGLVEGELSLTPPLNSIALQEIELFVVVGSKHKWWNSSEVPLSDLDGQAFIARTQGSDTRAWTDQLFTRNGISPRIVVEFDNPEAILQAVAAGAGISLLPDWAIPDRSAGARVRKIRVQGVRLNRTLRLIWSESRPLSLAAQAFLARLSEPFPIVSQLLGAGKPDNFQFSDGDRYKSGKPCSGRTDKPANEK